MKIKQTKENRGTVIAIVVFLGLLLVSYFYKANLKNNADITLTTNNSCDLRKETCTTVLPKGGKIHFSINPTSIPLLEPLAVQVETDNVEISKITIDFAGVSMDMGQNQAILTQTAPHHFTGKAILPACSHQKMEWYANVLLTTKQGVIKAPFYFYTLKNN
jgi:hypothetical protein